MQRDNPFDPINSREAKIFCTPELEDSLRKNVNEILQNNMLIDAASITYNSFNPSSAAYQEVTSTNSTIANSNGAVLRQNRIIDSSNTAGRDSFLLKSFLDLYLLLPSISLTSNNLSSMLDYDSSKLVLYFNDACPEIKNRVEAFKDSSWDIFARRADTVRQKLALITGAKADYEKVDSAISDSNDMVKRTNALIESYNDSISHINDSIYHIKWQFHTQPFPHIASGDSLQWAVKNAQPGDTFIIEGEISIEHLQLTSLRGTESGHISFLGNPWTTNVIQPSSGMFIDSGEFIDISHVVIRGSRGSGLKLDNWSNNIILRHCTLEGNNGYGLDIAASGVALDSCIVMNNGSGGINFEPRPTDFKLILNNVLIVKNRGMGIETITPNADVKFVTISNNDSDGINIVSPDGGYLSLFNSIISFNKGFGIFRSEGNPTIGSIQFGTVDFYQNAAGELSDGKLETISRDDPNFTDTTMNDFSIAPRGEIYNLQMNHNVIIGFR